MIYHLSHYYKIHIIEYSAWLYKNPFWHIFGLILIISINYLSVVEHQKKKNSQFIIRKTKEENKSR